MKVGSPSATTAAQGSHPWRVLQTLSRALPSGGGASPPVTVADRVQHMHAQGTA
eukprot:SAG22_NODE_17411_length_305_cov_0.985437_2_plen_53_part_01